MRSFYITCNLFLRKKKKKKKFGKRLYFSCFFNSFFTQEKTKQSRRPQKRKRAGTLNMFVCFTSPYWCNVLVYICLFHNDMSKNTLRGQVQWYTSRSEEIFFCKRKVGMQIVMMRIQLTMCTVGETGVCWHIFQKNAHKTLKSLISGMNDVLVKR